MKRVPASLFSAVLFVSCTALFAGDTLQGLKPDQVTLSGYGSFVNTRIVKFYNAGQERAPAWANFAVLNLVCNVRFGERLTGHVGLEGYTYHNDIQMSNYLMPVNKQFMYWTMYPHQVEGDISFGNEGSFHGEIGFGLMPYKYNHDAWNLGEYLFRSGTYPGYLTTNFDWTTSRLTGFKLSTTAFGSWHNDFLLTVNMEMPPYHDGTVSWLTDISLFKSLEIGAGISFCNILSADNLFTTPENENNRRITMTVNPDSTITPLDTNGYYTFKGIKTMFRLTFDPKVFLEDGSFIASMFGKEDGKIFGEAAVLGLENQHPCYGKITERMPIMFGLNIPAFRTLDVLSLQFEYYGSPYPDDYGNIYTYSLPGFAAPYTWDKQKDVASGFVNFDAFKHDNWKWSIYANRFFGSGKHFGIVAQAARDHYRTICTFDGFRDYSDALFLPKHWYWSSKAVFIF